MLKLISLNECFVIVGIILQCHLITSIHQENGIVKRMDIETCLAKFDVKSDMIIKTAESRKLGAKFLDSADALSKVECLHLCCETENCDVFVYEEKGQGECFLFHCGPAQDFRCKFSKHSNYTSAILSVEKKVSSPTVASGKKSNNPTVSLSQSEIELKSLKGKAYEPSNNKLSLNDSTATTTVVTNKAITAPIKNTASHCGRFQFQCHSGDCIAVYNACNGIPQCDDGSDEGPECQSITRAPEPIPNKPIHVQNAITHNREDPLTAPQWPNLNQSPNLGPVKQYSDDGNKIEFNHNGGLHSADSIQSSAQLPVDLSRQSFSSANSKDSYHTWNNVGGDPNLISNWPQQMPEFPIKSLQFQQKQQSFPQYQTDILPKNTLISDQLKGQQQYNWPIIGPNLANIPNLPNSPDITHLNHNNEEILPEKSPLDLNKDVAVPDRKKDGKNLLVQSKSESKSTEDSDYNNEEEEETTTVPPKKKKKHRKVNKVGKQEVEERQNQKDVGSQQMDAIQSVLQAEYFDHDGEADRPGGAVVSLALGILITIGLILVVSCRTTTVRKRVRRGKGYAHDADFLVNGMYVM